MALKYSRTFSVKLETPDGDCEFVFRKKPLNQLLDDADLMKKIEDKSEAVRKQYAVILDTLVEVRGMVDDEGKEIVAEDFKSLDMDLQIILQLVRLYNKATGIEDEAEKGNESSAAA